VELDGFDGLAGEAVERELAACNAAPRFAREVAAGRPYGSVAALADRAELVARSLTWAEVEIALAAHPRIGERAAGATTEAESSRREQAGMSRADADTRAAIEAGNRAYEERFGHVFLIRAAGRGPAELLAELTRRLGHDPAAERDETTGQLAEITRLRVERLVSG
jgi:2-oxo-4-hydroxy-4-carboxy-5-ureidoimidazoline decarboxylase